MIQNMETASADFQQHFGDTVDRVMGGEVVTVTRYGKPKFAMIESCALGELQRDAHRYRSITGKGFAWTCCDTIQAGEICIECGKLRPEPLGSSTRTDEAAAGIGRDVDSDNLRVEVSAPGPPWCAKCGASLRWYPAQPVRAEHCGEEGPA